VCRIQPAISLMGGLSILVAAYGTSAESGRLDSVGRIRHNLGVSDRSSECISTFAMKLLPSSSADELRTDYIHPLARIVAVVRTTMQLQGTERNSVIRSKGDKPR